MEERLTCPDCGVRYEEWEHDHDAYYVEDSRCLGCEKIGWAQRQWAEDETSTYGLRFRLVQRDT